MEKPPWGMTQVFRWFFVAQVGSFFVAILLLSFVFDDEGFPAETPIWLLVVTGLMIWVGYGLGTIITTQRTGSGPEVELGLKAPLNLYAGAAVLGVVTQLILLPALYWPILKLNPDLDVGEAAEKLTSSFDTPFEIAIFCLVAVVAAPVVEELFYRGLMLRGLTHHVHPALAVVISAFVFAAVHFQLIQLVGLFLFGLIAGAVVYFTDRVGVSIVLHMAFNLTAVVGLFWL